MAYSYETMMNPSVEELLDTIESKFILVTLAAKRSREITNYLGQVGVGVGAIVPPQVESQCVKPLSIALEEIAAGKIQAVVDDSEASEEVPEETSSAASGETSSADSENEDEAEAD